MKTIHITSQDELPDVAEAVIEALGRRTVVALRGEMGAGKTTLIREIAAQLGATDTVTSPTFAIVNQYKGKGNRRIHHFDFYRINDIREDMISVTKSIFSRATSVWSNGQKRSSSSCPRT